jgi:hypothetical protein
VFAVCWCLLWLEFGAVGLATGSATALGSRDALMDDGFHELEWDRCIEQFFL